MLLTQKMKKKYDGDQDLEIKIEILFPRGQFVCSSPTKHIHQRTQNHIIEFKKVVGTNENLNLFVLQQAKQCLLPEGSSWYSEHRGCVLSLQILSAFWVSLTLYRRARSTTFTPAPLLQFHNISAGHWTLSYLEKL